MSKLLLASYKIEFETTDITLDNLCTKYNLTEAELEGCKTWTKGKKTTKTEEPIEDLIIDNIEEPKQVVVTKPKPKVSKVANKILKALEPEPEQKQEVTIVDNDIESMNNKIIVFKDKALDEALKFMEKDVRLAEIKEFKDMVTIVNDIGKSLQKDEGPKAPTINVLVQNLVEKYEDDC